jgi:ribonuclease HI
VCAWFDGGTRPTNPGPSGAGIVVRVHPTSWPEPPEEPFETACYLSKSIALPEPATNNVAEYVAFIETCRLLNGICIRGDRVRIRGDSKLVLHQVSGQWKVNVESLKPLCETARSALGTVCGRVGEERSFLLDPHDDEPGDGVYLQHVRREFNKEADRLATNGAARAGSRAKH